MAYHIMDPHPLSFVCELRLVACSKDTARAWWSRTQN